VVADSIKPEVSGYKLKWLKKTTQIRLAGMDKEIKGICLNLFSISLIDYYRKDIR